jgi:glycerol-3-phosphate dehydrogenase
MNTRIDEMAHIAGEHFDLCVIGSGPAASACAMHAQSGGIRTLLVDSENFVGPTSSRVLTSPGNGGQPSFAAAIPHFHAEDFRHAISTIHDFVGVGGRAMNYAEVIDFRRRIDGTISGVVIKDQVGNRRFALNAKAVINATEPFSDQVRDLATSEAPNRRRTDKELYVLLPLEISVVDAEPLLLPETEDGRLIFATPWCGRLLIGMRNASNDIATTFRLNRDDVLYILSRVSPLLKRPPTLTDVVSGFVLSRPLFSMRRRSDASNEPQRNQVIEVDPTSALINLLHTSSDRCDFLAEEAVQVARTVIGSGSSDTAIPKLMRTNDRDDFGVTRYPDVYGDTMRQLDSRFGAEAMKVLERTVADRRLLERLVVDHPAIKAEVIYAVRHEMAVTIEDVLCRRIGLELYSWRQAIAAAPIAGWLMAEELDWSDRDARVAIYTYVNRVTKCLSAVGAF